jgi:diphosphomevalonate decarboxylase
MITWRCPSNIALIKYWGKHGLQLPMNPSLSISLSNSYTETSIAYSRSDIESKKISFEFFFEGKRKPAFENKIEKFFQLVNSYLPALIGFHFKIYSKNSFPHSSGIASSASSMGALALCLCSVEQELGAEVTGFGSFLEKASFLARLGSGSACRSIYGEYVFWGANTSIVGSSDEFAHPVPFKVHDNFVDICNAVLLVSSKTKKVSSSIGHELMHTNAYAHVRYEQAHKHFSELCNALKMGDESAFIQIVESEAFELHAMFMTSSPGFLLMEPDTIQILNKIRNFREMSGIMLCFTIDAGANVHLLYSGKNRAQVLKFIEGSLLEHCENGRWIDDKMGKGPERLA